MPHFEARVELACSPETAFKFLARPENIRLISPPQMMLVFDSAPEQLALNSRMEFRVQAYGVIRAAVHEITLWDPPHQFIEVQIQGPMGTWEHEHLFEATPLGVRVSDHIEFAPPGGMLGLLVNERKIREALEDAFAHRHQLLEKHLGKPTGNHPES